MARHTKSSLFSLYAVFCACVHGQFTEEAEPAGSPPNDYSSKVWLSTSLMTAENIPNPFISSKLSLCGVFIAFRYFLDSQVLGSGTQR